MTNGEWEAKIDALYRAIDHVCKEHEMPFYAVWVASSMDVNATGIGMEKSACIGHPLLSQMVKSAMLRSGSTERPAEAPDGR